MSPEQLYQSKAERSDLRAPQSSDFLSHTAHKPCGAMTLALYSAAPNTSRTFRSEQLSVCIALGTSVRMEWCSADSGKVHSTIFRPGHAEIIPAHMTIWQRCHEPAEFLVIGIDIQFVNRIAKRAMNRGSEVGFRHQSGIDDPKIKAFGTLLERELSDQGKDRELYSNSLADALALHLVEHYGTVSDRSMGTLSPSRVKAVLGYINENLADDLSVRMLADVVHMSPYHFAHCFKQTVGIAPHRYVLLPLKFNRAPLQLGPIFRFLEALTPWGMMEVYMLSVLVAIVKLADLATIVPGVALYSFVALIVIMSAYSD